MGDFSKLTPEQVLLETEKASLDGRLYTQHQALISARHRCVRSHDALSALTSSLSALRRRNAGLSSLVVRYREHRTALQRLDLIKRKLPWVRYESARLAVNAAKEARAAAADALKAAEADAAPLVQRMRAIEAQQTKADGEKRRAADRFQHAISNINGTLRAVNESEPKADEVRERFARERAEREALERRRKTVAKELQEAQRQVEEAGEEIDIAPLTAKMVRTVLIICQGLYEGSI